MSHLKKVFISILTCITLFITSTPIPTVLASSEEFFPFVILSQYEAVLDIGGEICLYAISSGEKLPTWRSSNSRVASVNTYGVVTAKKYGSAVITAKIKNAEASCYITVNKTEIILNRSSALLEHGDSCELSAKTSNDSKVVWKSNKKSIATVNADGMVTAQKPGEAIITATADGSSASCTIIVKSPSVQLSKDCLTLYRGQSAKLSASVSSRLSPIWKSNKKSIAVVNSDGTVTALKNGTATITATVDRVVATCNITVLKPDISLSSEEITVKKGEGAKLSATVSSGNTPTWSSSNTNLVTINSYGEIKAKQKGKAYVYATEDGTKARCTVYVTE
jgi:uncharacterized protein YjdB